MNELLSLYENHDNKVSDKWEIYLQEYDRLLSIYKDKKINFLEIGVQNGGSLEIWSKYFAKAKCILGCDINPKCGGLIFDDPRINVTVGDACNISTKNEILGHATEFDVIIEDGSHTSSDIIKTFALYFKNLKNDGLFIFEDLHCSYWQEYEGGLYDPYSSMNFFKALSDVINYQHWGVEKNRNQFLSGFEEKYGINFEQLDEIHSIEFFNSVCVIKKKIADKNVVGSRFIAGRKEDVVEGHLQDDFPKRIPVSNQLNNRWSVMLKSPAEQWDEFKLRYSIQTQQLNDANQQLNDANQQLETAQSSLNLVLSSKSWKLTTPLRAAVRFIQLRKKAVRDIRSSGLRAFISRVKLTLFGLKNSRYTYKEPTFDKKISKEIKELQNQPLISIIMPVYNVDPKWIDAAINSVERQWYQNWELCIADDASTNNSTLGYLNSLSNTKIKVKFLAENKGISEASNAALDITTGDYIALMDNDDEITPDALYHVVKAINEHDSDFIYSDEDKLQMDGVFTEPHFKAEFSPDLLFSQNYISHFCVIKKSLIEEVGRFQKGLEGAQDYDLYLKVLEHTNKVVHIPRVLYHWRKIPGSTATEFSEKSFAQAAGKKALQDAVSRRGLNADVEDGKFSGTYRVKYNIENNPLVSVIVPFKDKPELLRVCIDSILEKSSYSNYEIIAINNNSEEKETFELMEALTEKDQRVRFYDFNFPFNYSEINNYAIKNYAHGEHVVLLNNDVEIISHGWIEAMLEFSQRTDVGAVGAKLYYPNNTVQHAGVVIGIGGVAGHSHKNFDKHHHGYFSRLAIIQNLSAVTGACLMVKTSLYNDVGGLNEVDLKVAFNDVDFCLRLREKGYLNVFTPFSEAYHHESVSRGKEDDPVKAARFNHEVEYMMDRHKKILNEGDPFYNPNLTLKKEDFSLKD